MPTNHGVFLDAELFQYVRACENLLSNISKPRMAMGVRNGN